MKRALLRNAKRAGALLGGLSLLAFLAAAIGFARPGWPFGVAAVLLLGATIVLAVWARWQHERAIREALLPPFLKRKLLAAYPQLSGKDADLVERGLRQFFLACLRANGKFVAMPSRAVDAMWHEFILHTRAYRDWCSLALGRFLHHTPAEALGGDAKHNDGLRRAWYWACKDEAIDPRKPTRLPLLFALDAKLVFPAGFHYLPDCRDIAAKSAAGGDGSGSYCGTAFGDGSSSGDGDGFGGSEGSGGDGDGGGGCGGD